jgi:hypothetical protein
VITMARSIGRPAAKTSTSW